METKEFTREQLDVLAGLVLAEMGGLREFGNAHHSATCTRKMRMTSQTHLKSTDKITTYPKDGGVKSVILTK